MQQQNHTFHCIFETYVIGCKNELPAKMKSESSCKNLKKSCSNLKNECTSKLGSALGSSERAKRCRTALGSAKNRKVQSFCKIACNKCGKLIEYLIRL